MFSHERIWAAIDLIAQRNALTTSGLARKAGLDPTTFNRSKRIGSDGRLRWPSTESIAKVLEATGEQLDDFVQLLSGGPQADSFDRPFRQLPLIALAQAGAGGFFDDGGFPAGPGWHEVTFPQPAGSERVYALEVSGDSMLPLYRDGDIIVVSPAAPCRKGDRVVVRSRAGEMMAMVLALRSPTTIELTSLNPHAPPRTLPADSVDWMARIIWASQ